MRRADPHQALIRALLARHPELTIHEACTERWASVTFTGMRHVLRCAPLDMHGLEEAELVLPGHVVADIMTQAGEGVLIVEALTIETD
jgi:hypothetical protein